MSRSPGLGAPHALPLSLALLALLVAGCAATTGVPDRAIRGAPHVAPLARVVAVRPLVEEAARQHGVDPALVLGVIDVESSFRPEARSTAGARGLMQLMPRTAESLARRLGRATYAIDDPEFNVAAGTSYLAYLQRLFGGELRLALAAYNTGPARVRRWERDGRPLPAESRRYVAAVLAARDRFAAGALPAAAASPAGVGGAELDRDGLSALLRRQQARYGERPDEPLPGEAQPTSAPAANPPAADAPRAPATTRPLRGSGAAEP